MSSHLISLITGITALLFFGIYKILRSLAKAINKTIFRTEDPRDTLLGDRKQEDMVREQARRCREVEEERSASRSLRASGVPAAAGGRTLSPPVYSGYSPSTRENAGIPFRVAKKLG